MKESVLILKEKTDYIFFPTFKSTAST